MASSSLKRGRTYDVFLSFRGTDVRKNFLSHLYMALNQKGLFTFKDDEELRKGEHISSALIKAIEESRVAIIIFSKDYASSRWCLEELAKIMECEAQKNQLVVLPVFYEVEPREVREGRESYKRAMDKHESKFGKASEEVKRWKKALFDAGSLSGWEFNDGDEAKFIKSLMKEISRQVDRTPLYVAKHPVGIPPRVLELKSMLNLEFDDDVVMIGLWGQGGIGKTTLGKALYNAIFRQFEGACFLANVRETSGGSNGLVSLQEQLMSDLLVGKGFTIRSVDRGIKLIQDRICCKKVLLILDDVSDVEQLNALVGDREWFAKGSRIIVITRDRHLLTLLDIDEDHIYQVQSLENCKALELFNKHVFARNSKIVIREDLVDNALRYADGLPLALEVLGSFLYGRKEQYWKEALSRLAKSPDQKINKVLMLSYDGLEHNEKEIFLDIACFFKGRTKEYIMKVLDSCDFDTTIGIQVLLEKSLIFDNGRTLGMHDLIQMMGMGIVQKECLDNPGKRSRLWLYDDVHHVLSNDLGTNAVKAIVVDLPEPKEMNIDLDAFANMKRLRVLIMINVHTTFQSPIYLPDELRWFQWPECPWFPEFSSCRNKLVGLDLQRSNIQLVTEQLKDYKKLKFINFSECESLVCMPDLDCMPYLEELDLHGCKNLEHFPNVLQSQNLQLLNLDHCSKVETFPDIPDEVQGLRILRLEGTAIEELPVSIENLVSLEEMHLQNCKKLAILPSSIYWLRNLEELNLFGCSKLLNFPKKKDSSDPFLSVGFPKLKNLALGECNLSEVDFLENRSCFPMLSFLNLSGNNFTELPACEHLYELESLIVHDCQQLRETLKIPRQLKWLSAANCESLRQLPSGISRVHNIEYGGCEELDRSWLTVNDLFKLEHFCTESDKDVCLPGGEMPEWLVPNDDGYISFMVSKDLFEKFIGLVGGVVLQEKKGVPCGLVMRPSVNGKDLMATGYRFEAYSDHVWLRSLNTEWQEIDFDPDGWSNIQLIVRALPTTIVRNCGFRLIWKPLGNDLKGLLRHNPSLDPALVHEVGHDDSRTSRAKESSDEREDLLDSKTCTEENCSSDIVLKGPSIADFVSQYRYAQTPWYHGNIHPGGELPKKFVLVEQDTISFMASQDLYDKILGLTLCVVYDIEDEEKEISFDIVPYINGQRRNVLSGTLDSVDSDHIWTQYLKSNVLWGMLEGAIDFDQLEERCLNFSLQVKVLGGTMKKLGYIIRCKPLEDDYKVVLENNQLVNPASLCEDFDEIEYSQDDWQERQHHLEMEFLCKCHILHKDTDGYFHRFRKIPFIYDDY